MANLTSTIVNGDLVVTNEIIQAGFRLIDLIYPVGSLYWTEDTNFNPNTSFGGTWKKIKDKFIYAVDSGATIEGETGGSASRSVPLLAHTHEFTPKGTINPTQHNHTVNVGRPCGNLNGDNWGWRWINPNRSNLSVDATTSKTSLSFTGTQGTTAPTGDKAPSIDIMPPYEKAYCWKRTA